MIKPKRKIKQAFLTIDDEDDAPTRSVATRGVPTLIDKKKIKKKIKLHDTDNAEGDQSIARSNASVFEKNLKSIRRANERHNYGEQAILTMYKHMYDMVCDLIPIAEENYRKFKIDKSAYALNTYLNQAREIANDMRSVNNYEEQVKNIVEMMRRQYSLIAQNMVEEVHNTTTSMRAMVRDDQRGKVDELLGQLTKGQAKFLNESLKGVSDMLVNMLLEKPTTKQAKIAGKS